MNDKINKINKINKISYAQAAIFIARLNEHGKAVTIENLDEIFNGSISTQNLKEYCQIWHSRQNEEEPQVFPLSSQTEINSRLENSINATVYQRTKELEESLALVKATLESTADGILIISNEGQLVDWNEKFIEIMKINNKTMRRRDESGGVAQLLSQVKDPQEFIELMQSVYQNPKACGNMGNLHFKDGRIIERYSQPHKIDNNIVGRVWSFRDITHQVESQENLKLREQVIEASINGIIITKAKPPYLITYVNPAVENLTLYTKDELIGKPYDFLQNEDINQDGLKVIRRALSSQKSSVNTIRNYKKNGDMFWNELHISPVPNNAGDINHYVGIMLDVTEKKKIAQKITHRANHDFLTDLPNRNHFLSETVNKIIEANFDQTKLALLFLDLDHFKFINDRLGHIYGDQLLLAISSKLKTLLGYNHLLSRFGGDEFVILIENFKNQDTLIKLVNKILLVINQTINVKGHDLNTTASIGISIFPEHAKNITDLLICSDIAMYQAKEEGRNRYCLYNSKIKKDVNLKMNIENSLHSALSNNEFSLVYQPILNIKNKQIIGAECLIRWQQPELGMIPPDKFIPIAELNGQINPIGTWVLTKACQKFSIWQKKYNLDFIAINISTRQLKVNDFADKVSEILYEYNLKPENIELELTEGIFIDDSNVLIENIDKLKKLGIKISIDDFGTGFSNFSYLKRFKIDKIKIDRSFIMPLNKSSARHENIIPISMINLGRDLGLTVLAEGIENEYQQQFLIDNNCLEGQGYFLGKPMSADDFEKKLSK